MNYWLVKTEPGNYSINDLQKQQTCVWDGVRNFQARNFLMKMKRGDVALIYHSIVGTEVVGEASVTSEYYTDPTDETKKFVCVDMKFIRKFSTPYTLAQIKKNPALNNLLLIRQSRLSVMPLTDAEYKEVLSHCGC